MSQSGGSRTFIHLADDLICEIRFVGTVWKFIKKEGRGVRDGRVLFTVILVFALAAACYLTHRIDIASKPETTALKEVTATRPVPIAAMTPTASATPQPKSLYEFFKSDFARLGSFSSDLTFHGEDGSKIKGVKALWFPDYESHSQFISIYIPFSVDPYKICQSIPDGFDKILDIWRGSMVITSKDPADSLSEKSTDLVVTGKIYIYHERPMSHEQIAALEKLFTSKKLTPQFRSLDYASVRWLQSIATPPSPIPNKEASPN